MTIRWGEAFDWDCNCDSDCWVRSDWRDHVSSVDLRSDEILNFHNDMGFGSRDTRYMTFNENLQMDANVLDGGTHSASPELASNPSSPRNNEANLVVLVVLIVLIVAVLVWIIGSSRSAPRQARSPSS
ncbi:hypothetical protein GJ744_011598 [Endocarpon pusillum]|uniref:Uncharacterized protein n=1 Tax=Endocarpon pusillum TaxID=364733 RepID=A0A8H7E4P1_9EURO|nr:hypothetical protein GJ744_011598 [Endocarpon pusillum]